jgi:tRNA-modifying protein YgfZ
MSAYQALRSQAAQIDLSSRGKLRLTGEDCARLLHAMSTNDIQNLPTGSGRYAFFLNAQGRILADAYIYRLGETFWLDTEPAVGPILAAHLDKYVIADDVNIDDETAAYVEFGLEGPQFLEAAARLEIPVPAEPFGCAAWEGGFVARTGASFADGLRILLPRPAGDRLASLLSPVPLASAGDAEVVRIENGIPRYGADISDRFLVQETGITRAVHSNKGCYLGQEIVERVRSRGQVHRHLSQLRLAGNIPPAAGSKVYSGEKEVGEITSAAFSPGLGEIAALGYLRTEATIGELPLQVEAATARRLSLVAQ